MKDISIFFKIIILSLIGFGTLSGQTTHQLYWEGCLLGCPIPLDGVPQLANHHTITNSQLGSYSIDPANVNSQNDQGFYNLAGLDNFTKNIIKSNIQKAFTRWSMSMAVITSADCTEIEVSDGVTISSAQVARDTYESLNNDLNGPDLVVWVHYNDGGEATFTVELNPNFLTSIPINLSLQELDELEEQIKLNIYTNASKNILGFEALESHDPDDDIELDVDDGQRPLYFGFRTDEQYDDEKNFFGILKAIGGIGYQTVREGAMPKQAWEVDKICLFDLPGLVVGPFDACVEENPVIGLFQLASLVQDLGDPQVRGALIDALLSPVKMARAFFHEKHKIYTGTDKELMHYDAGKTSVSTLLLILTVDIAELADMIAGFGKKAQHAAYAFRELLEDFPTDLKDKFNKRIEDLIPEDITESLLDFFNDIGKGSWGKIVENPDLVNVWKKFKDDLEVNLVELYQKFPNSGDFYTKFSEVFMEAGGVVADKTKVFIQDLQNTSNGDLLMIALIGQPLKIKAWKVLFSDQSLRKNTDKLAKVNDYATNFGKSFDDIEDEFVNVPASQRSGWIDHLEFRTNGKQVNKAGGRASEYGSFNSNADVPQKYSSDSRFDDLSFDPATNNTNSAKRQEAMAGLEAESQNLIDGPISRDQTGNFEFIDGSGNPIDVKAPRGEFVNAPQVGNSIKSQLLDPDVKVLFDTTWINDAELSSIRSWLQSNVSTANLERVIEVNSNLF